MRSSSRQDIRRSTVDPAHRALFERLYKEEFAYVQRTVKRYGVWERELADVTQEVFARVYGHISDYDITRPARSWLYAFAIRLAIDYCALRRHVYEELAGRPPEVIAQESSPEELLIEREAQDAIRKAIQQLRPELQTILLLHDVEERTMPEIVQQLGIPLNTGYTRLRRARAQLRRHLTKYAAPQPGAG